MSEKAGINGWWTPLEDLDITCLDTIDEFNLHSVERGCLNWCKDLVVWLWEVEEAFEWDMPRAGENGTDKNSYPVPEHVARKCVEKGKKILSFMDMQTHREFHRITREGVKGFLEEEFGIELTYGWQAR